MEKPSVDFSFEMWQAGHYSLTAKTNWPDLCLAQSGLKVAYTFSIIGKGRNWNAHCHALNKTFKGCRTLRQARQACQSYLLQLTGIRLKNLEIWLNSGGFLCVGGNYRGYYLYATKQPLQEAWEVRADKSGQIGFRKAGQIPTWLINDVKADIDALVNPVTKTSLQRDLAELPF